MKKLLLTILIVIIAIPMFGQDVRFPSLIVSAGGGSDGSPVNLTKWRVGQVHVFTLPADDKLKDRNLNNEDDWLVSIYPNPVKNFLYLEFELPESKELFLRITDVAGRVVFIQEARSFINGSIVELNLSEYSPMLYILQISSPDLSSQKVFRIQKI